MRLRPRYQDILQMLLDAKADLSASGQDAKLAFDWAHLEGHHEIASLLLNEADIKLTQCGLLLNKDDEVIEEAN